MRRLATIGFAPLFALAACGDDGGSTVDAQAPSNPGFPVPTAVTKANEIQKGSWVELGDADWSCLNTPTADQPSTQAIALTGLVSDFQLGTPVGNATVTAFPGIMLSATSGTAVSSNVAATRGEYSMTLARLPSGQTRVGFKIEAAGSLKTYLLNQYLNPANATQNRNIDAVSETTAAALPALVGATREVGTGVLAGALRDCAGNEVSNAVATVSSTPGAVNHLPGTVTYYFSAASTSLPVRHSTSPTSNKDGLFVMINIAPQTANGYVQIWGFPTAADLAMGAAGLKLLAELETPVEADAVITGSFEAKRN